MQINALRVVSSLLTLLLKLFCKRLQIVNKEQNPFWEMIQVAVAEYQVITRLGCVRSLITLYRNRWTCRAGFRQTPEK